MTDAPTDADNPAPDAQASGAGNGRILGMDIYNFRARVMPALLTSLPVIALGLVALPWLEQAEKLWSLAGLGLTTFAALIARRAGNRVQPDLLAAWGGMPTTHRLRFSSETSPEEIERRHQLVERILGGDLRLPTSSDERQDPAAADVRYADAVRRIVARLRNNPKAPLVTAENRNYGFARNMLGLKPVGVASAAACLVTSLAAAAFMLHDAQGIGAAFMLMPTAVAVASLCLWPMVDPSFVRPSADAYADRVVDALDDLDQEPRHDG